MFCGGSFSEYPFSTGPTIFLPWVPVDTEQTANWTSVNDSNTITWTAVNTSSNITWVQINTSE